MLDLVDSPEESFLATLLIAPYSERKILTIQIRKRHEVITQNLFHMLNSLHLFHCKLCYKQNYILLIDKSSFVDSSIILDKIKGDSGASKTYSDSLRL